MRLIDADALLEHIKDMPTWYNDDGYVYGQNMRYPEGMYDPEDVISAIKNAPTIAAGPTERLAAETPVILYDRDGEILGEVDMVIHAHWERTGGNEKAGLAYGTCSHCHREAWTNYELTPRCPYCGAYMDEVKVKYSEEYAQLCSKLGECAVNGWPINNRWLETARRLQKKMYEESLK